MTDVATYLALPYTRVLRRDEDGDVVASIQELPGCTADGANESEALENLEAVQRSWIEEALRARIPIPIPQEEEDLPSGKWMIRAPKTLHWDLTQLAEKDETSLNQLCVAFLAEGVERRRNRAEMRLLIASLHQPFAAYEEAFQGNVSWQFDRPRKRLSMRFKSKLEAGPEEIMEHHDDLPVRRRK
jgi:predicted RNase H-like HicB family nuclease